MLATILDRWPEYDAAVQRLVFSTLQRAGFSEMQPGRANAVLGALPFVASPTPMVTMILAYLAIVAIGLAVIKLRGPRAARTEDPAWLRFLVQARAPHRAPLSLPDGRTGLAPVI